jgi:hypothetical protein
LFLQKVRAIAGRAFWRNSTPHIFIDKTKGEIMDNWSKALCVAAGCGCIIGFAAFGPNLGDQPSDKIKNPAEKCLISIKE